MRQHVLAHCGMVVHVEPNGLGALPALDRFRPDAVVLDILLPGMDGEHPLDRIRASNHELPVMILTARDAARDNDAIALTAREFDLLHCLALNANRVLSRDVILDRVWDAASPGPNVVDVYIGYLRKKIDTDGRVPLIRTVRGDGFTLRER